jgi:glycosyltransferase involved in cell wall biosynthesis
VRIVSLSWRYIGHPAAGGAEGLTHEVHRRWVAQGHQVTAFTASYPGVESEDELDGVRILRRGAQATVHLAAWRWLRRRLDGYDRVLDQINTIPFMTPLYVPAGKRFFLIYQLAREYWWRETRGPMKAIAPAGYALEPLYLRLYRRTPGLTISDSTRQDLARLGVGDVAVVPPLLRTTPLGSLPPKAARPLRLLVAGRLTPAKFVEEAIRAFGEVRTRVADAVLDVIGGGDESYRRRLEREMAVRGIDGARFHGHVSEDRKHELMRNAHVHMFTSHREGWGLVVSEAGAMGTPSVGYDVPGVRDSIADPSLLAPCGDHRTLAALAESLWSDRGRYQEARRQAWERARALTPEATAEGFAAALRLHSG